MPSTYKTPGVYVEEITKFPPSVAPVATAVPAFLGYTEKAQHGDQSLSLQPTKIRSLLEYEAYFGGPPPREINALHIDANNTFVSVEMESKFYLYDSLQLFFQNGGGSCYIVSIGVYQDLSGNYTDNELSDYQDGLAALKLKDEPTLIVFPDAVNINPATDIYQLQKEVLQQCNHLQDRFAIFDLLEARSGLPNYGFEDGVNEFRQQIGMSNLKYGAAYGPYLQTNLPIPVTYATLKGNVERGGTTILLKNLTSDSDTQDHLDQFDLLLDDQTSIQDGLDNVVDPGNSLVAQFQNLVDAALTANGSGTGDNEVQNVFTFLYDLISLIEDWGSNLTFTNLQTDIQTLVGSTLSATLTQLVANEKEADSLLGGTFYEQYNSLSISGWWGVTISSVNASGSINGGTDIEQRESLLQLLHGVFTQLSAGINTIVNYTESYIHEHDNTLYEKHTVFRNLATALQNHLSTLPASGAIAGVYARVDRDRGVWKSPANVSLSGVKALTHTIDNDIQDDLNVDVTAGKSINAIRAFTGKGILVWGARTLAGNDNEWRYVSVRRFFIMAEESIRKATSAFVFEPNDANTWVRVRAMVENFLALQWRAGALAGSKPEDAFYVHVGLGSTMTNVDVLEGRMIIEIGMAVVRPAEFIILRLSHKMQEA